MTPTERTDQTLVTRAVASLLIGLIFAAAFVYAFNFTWPQGIVLSWLYCLLKDSIDRKQDK